MSPQLALTFTIIDYLKSHVGLVHSWRVCEPVANIKLAVDGQYTACLTTMFSSCRKASLTELGC